MKQVYLGAWAAFCFSIYCFGVFVNAGAIKSALHLLFGF